jgi:Domain of unknown function (DUF4276)
MGKSTRFLIIEGTTDTTNGDLRQAFGRLFEQKLAGKRPRIVMGDGKNQTIDKFKFYHEGDNISALLVDLDDNEKERENKIHECKLTGHERFVFFMIQEMEAWFLSQPEILTKYYNEDFDKKIKRAAADIPDPCGFLEKITVSTKKGKYHKVKDGVELLPRLVLSKLCADFADVNNMIQYYLSL